MVYGTMQGANVTYQAASDVDSRGNFTHNGNLNSQQHSNINFTSDSSSVFAISRDLGTIQITQNPVVWAIGYTTDAPINYTDLSGATRTSRDPYYKIQYSNDTDMVSVDGHSWEMMCLTLKYRLSTSSMISAMRLQGLTKWTAKQSAILVLSQSLLDRCFLLQSPRCTAACS